MSTRERRSEQLLKNSFGAINIRTSLVDLFFLLLFFFKVWLCLVLLATVLPLILWKNLKYLWRHYDEPTTTTAQQGRTSDINSLGLAHQYFFVLSVLVAQCIIQCAILILKLIFNVNLVFLSCVRITCTM